MYLFTYSFVNPNIGEKPQGRAASSSTTPRTFFLEVVPLQFLIPLPLSIFFPV